MARGYYDVPQARPKPTYGPQRPPVYPPPSIRLPASCSSPDSASSSVQPSPSIAEHRHVVVFFSPMASEMHTTTARELTASLPLDVVVREVHTVDEALVALSQKPSAVIVPEDILDDPSLEFVKSAAHRYVQNGGTLITDLSRAKSTLHQFGHTRNDSFDHV